MASTKPSLLPGFVPGADPLPFSLGRLAVDSERERPHLIWHLPALYQTLSWALVGGGWRESASIAWLQVRDLDLPLHVCARRFLQTQLNELECPDAVGLMTSAKVSRYEHATVKVERARAHVVVTVGLGNALRAGDPLSPPPPAGTINIACCLEHRLSFAAALEAQALIAEAKAAVLADLGIRSRISQQPATGTGTDCHVLAFPLNGHEEVFAGKHTAVGCSLGQAVSIALTRAVTDWKRQHPHHPVLGGPQ